MCVELLGLPYMVLMCDDGLKINFVYYDSGVWSSYLLCTEGQ